MSQHEQSATPATKSEKLADVMREHIIRILSSVGGDKKAAALALGISRRALYRRLERYGLGDDTIMRRREVSAVMPAPQFPVTGDGTVHRTFLPDAQD